MFFYYFPLYAINYFINGISSYTGLYKAMLDLINSVAQMDSHLQNYIT